MSTHPAAPTFVAPIVLVSIQASKSSRAFKTCVDIVIMLSMADYVREELTSSSAICDRRKAVGSTEKSEPSHGEGYESSSNIVILNHIIVFHANKVLNHVGAHIKTTIDRDWHAMSLD